MELDVDFVRAQYAAFQNPETAGWAFFENAGGSYVPRQVFDRLHHFFQFTKVQPYGLFPATVRVWELPPPAGEAMEEGYRCMAELLNADEDELTVGPSTSMNLYVLAQAIRPTLAPGDEIIVTNQDHEANIGCWERLGEFGASIKEWRIDPLTGELSVDALKNLVSERTRLICFTLCSNIVGTINDVQTISRIAHDVNALAIADGVSFAPHQIADVNTLGVDLYLFSTYKTFGTHLGVMWGKKKVLANLKCQGHYFNCDKPHYRFNPAGPLHAEIGALAGIGEYYDAIYENQFDEHQPNRHERAGSVFRLFGDYESRLANILLESVQDLPGVRIVGQLKAAPGRRAATISLISENRRPSEVVTKLLDSKLAVRNGHFYAVRCLEALGIEDPEEGVIRISLVHYNTEDEVHRLAEGLKDVLA